MSDRKTNRKKLMRINALLEQTKDAPYSTIVNNITDALTLIQDLLNPPGDVPVVTIRGQLLKETHAWYRISTPNAHPKVFAIIQKSEVVHFMYDEFTRTFTMTVHPNVRTRINKQLTTLNKHYLNHES